MNYNLLAGKRGIIFGALDEQSLAWQAALKIKENGGDFVLTNTPLALRLGALNKLADHCQAAVIPADATVISDIEQLFEKAITTLGGKIDFILHSVAMSPNVRKQRSYENLNYDCFLKTLDISALSFHKVLQTAEKLDALNHWASIIAISYIAAQRTFPAYSDMAEAKAMLESIARSFGYRLAKQKKIRVNTISQSPTFTKAGSGVPGFDTFYRYAALMSPLGNASAEDCANFIVLMFSDLSKMVTMQNLMHDGGFSNTGITENLIEALAQRFQDAESTIN